MYRFIQKLLPVVLLCSLLPSGLSPEHFAVQAAEAPINPAASAEARELYTYLSNLDGEGMITGQHDYLESPDELNKKLKRISGQYAGLHGYELGAISNQSAEKAEAQRSNVVDSAINWHNEGGIVAMTFHQALPGKPLTWPNVQIKLTQAEFNRYVTPGTAEYASLIADLDKVAVSLGKLRDAGVPVLWRPYHEMNGNWFWWGKKKRFVKLWDIMYDRFVNVHQLNNLLWVWNPNAPNAWSAPYRKTFPGLSKVDILAADIYDNDFRQSYYDGLLNLAGGKPIAIGEHGEMPSENVLLAQPRWVYSMTWGKMLTENNSNDDIVAYMNEDRTLNRDELIATMAPPVESPPVQPSEPNPPAAPPAEEEPAPPKPVPPKPDPPKPDPPGPAPSDPDTVDEGLNVEFFNNTNLSGTPVLTRTDAKLDFNWRGAAPAPAVHTDQFSVRWTGKVKPKYSETYTFTTISDDGIRVWVNGQLIIDSWIKQSWTERKGSISLEADQFYDIKVEFYDGTGDAMARLMWESQQVSKAIIPSSALFHSVE
ncbi:glycosyl hydrolase [Paenibacillus zeirhizosphaerae]